MRDRAAGTALAVALAAIALLALAPGAVADPPAPGAYQEDDGLGFRNIAPPGQDGVVDQLGVFDFIQTGNRPPHNNDQLDEYDTIVQAAPGLTEPQVDGFFKDASFGVPPGQVEESYTPDCTEDTAPAPSSEHCDDVAIVRDSSFGVPHIYGATRAGAMFGAGYVAAEDRLFLMDFERHLGRAQLSSFAGGSNVATDRALWRAAPYTEADLQAQHDDLDELRGAEGAQVQADVQSYVDGINQYIGEGRAFDPDSPLPGEYVAALGDDDGGPEPWKVTDIVATATLVAGRLGKGGGGEVGSALVLEEAVERFGATDGREAWSDFRSREDTESPTTVHDGSFPYGTPPASPTGVALPDAGTTVQEPVVVPGPGRRANPKGPAPFHELLDLEGASNALLISDAESAGDHPLAVMGPQVGYFSPQILQELDIHAPADPGVPGIDARGVGFSGISMYVLLGRGQDYAWSATSAGQDIADTYAMELCDPANPGDPGEITDDGYRYDGACTPFEVLERVNEWEPIPADDTPAGTETLRSLRTKLGIVSHRAMIGGVPHVYTQLRATYMHEADSAVAFAAYNQPATMEDAGEFAEAASAIDYSFNWLYADDEQISYFNSGANPVRPANVDPNLPIEGEPANTWSGFDPADLTFDRAPASEHPQVTDQDWISSWNNKQAPGFSAADDNYSYGSVHRVDSLNERIEAGTAGAETMTRVELVDAMEDAATVDLRGSQVLEWALRAIERRAARDNHLQGAVDVLEAWRQSGAHRIDRDGNGAYENAKAVRTMDAWWPRLVKAQFRPALGKGLFERIESIMGLDNAPGPVGSAYLSGWYGYVEKDLRSIYGEPVADPFSREYCGGGKRGQCAKALADSLERALRHRSNSELYPGHPTTECQELPSTPNAQWCWDSIRATAIGAITQPPIDWQNRPTFQQVVEAQNDVP